MLGSKCLSSFLTYYHLNNHTIAIRIKICQVCWMAIVAYGRLGEYFPFVQFDHSKIFKSCLACSKVVHLSGFEPESHAPEACVLSIELQMLIQITSLEGL